MCAAMENHEDELNEQDEFVRQYAEIRDNAGTIDERRGRFAELVRKSSYVGELTRIACNSLALDDDLVSDTWLLTYEKVSRTKFPFRTSDKIAGYIFIALKRNAISILRKKKHQSPKQISFSQFDDEPDGVQVRSNFYDSGTIFRASNGEILSASLAEYLSAMRVLKRESTEDATCIKLRLQGVTREKIAKAMGISHYVCDRAKERFMAILERECRR